uniref:Uncharacterized protein n=1 Tax=Anguilla anguilla TaxID=7936 RepID=A0A0E9S4D5_ANGAN
MELQNKIPKHNSFHYLKEIKCIYKPCPQYISTAVYKTEYDG